jgi:hypothetical protein
VPFFKYKKIQGEKNMKGFVTQICNCSIAINGDNHEPPIGFGGGSFFVDIPNEFMLSADAGVSGNHVYNILGTSGSGHKDFTAIRNIGVLTEVSSDGSITFDNYKVEEDDGVLLQLWLSTDKTDPGSRAADVIVNGGSGSSGSITSKDALTLVTPDLSKSRRKKRHKHADPLISVVKWALVRPDPQNPQNLIPVYITAGKECSFSSDDLYYIFVAFYHDE